MMRTARAVIDPEALRFNLQRVREAAPASRVMAVVKSDGYGHGLVRVARALDGADAFAVACVEEGVALREAGITAPVAVLQGFLGPSELRTAARRHLEPVVHHPDQVYMLERTRLERPVRLWLKIDTGMHRLGFPSGQAVSLWRRLSECPAVAAPVRLMTHLACADDRADSRTREQMAAFREALAGVTGERSVANSAGVLAWPDTHLEWVRPGIMLYGVSPFIGGTGAEENLRPAMTLATRLIAVNHRRKGEAVGYGGSWVCPDDMPVGVAAVGYGDGYPRHAGPGTPVLVNGRRVPLVGRVSMDMICVDLRNAPDARPGDPVVLWGEGLPVEEVARHAGTIAYELLCGVSQRVETSVAARARPRRAEL